MLKVRSSNVYSTAPSAKNSNVNCLPLSYFVLPVPSPTLPMPVLLVYFPASSADEQVLDFADDKDRAVGFDGDFLNEFQADFYETLPDERRGECFEKFLGQTARREFRYVAVELRRRVMRPFDEICVNVIDRINAGCADVFQGVMLDFALRALNETDERRIRADVGDRTENRQIRPPPVRRNRADQIRRLIAAERID